MRSLFRNLLRRSELQVAALVIATIMLSIVMAVAQTRPTTTPTYLPNGIIGPTTLSAAGTVGYVINGDGALAVEVGGTNTSVVGEFDVATDRSASPNWMSLGPITANGNYRFNISGFAQARFKLTSIGSGSVTVYMSGDNAAYSGDNGDKGAVITNSTQGAATVNSATYILQQENGVSCSFVQTSTAGSPSTTFGIQAFDSASGLYTTLLTSGAITDAALHVLEVYPAVQTSSLPTNYTALGLHMPRLWRVTETVGGSGTPQITGTIGCNTLR